MVTVKRSELEKKLSVITSSLPSISTAPLLGRNINGLLTFWQDSYMPIWDSVSSEGNEEFEFSVDPSQFGMVVNKFKSATLDLNINSKKAMIISSGKSKVTVPYRDGPYDEIPEAPIMEISCTVGRDFLKALAKSKDFVSKTYENMGLTYSYIGHRNGEFFITGAGTIYQYATFVPFIGEILPDVIVPPQYASIAPRLFASESVQIGLSDRQQVVMSDGSTIIYTRSANETYPTTAFQLADAEGELLFTSNKKVLLESLRLALTTTKEDMVGLSGSDGKLELYIPNAVLEADLIVEDVSIVQDFSRSYFSLPFLIKCINSFDEDEIKVELLPRFNGAFRIGTKSDKEITVLQSISYLEP